MKISELEQKKDIYDDRVMREIDMDKERQENSLDYS